MNNQRGFTLVEAIVAVGVVVVLSGMIIPVVVKHLEDAKLARARNDVKAIATAIAAQLKDTGTRPVGLGLDNSDARLQQTWGSGGSLPKVVAGDGGEQDITDPGNNTLAKALSAAWSNANPGPNTLFGFPNAHPQSADSASYRGPYLSSDMAGKADPWGRQYIVLGYNKTSRDNDGPIWVVCAGPKGRISHDNTDLQGNRYPPVWTYNAESDGNIAIQVR
jgi:type II secretory pathway pseudopilin PulG